MMGLSRSIYLAVTQGGDNMPTMYNNRLVIRGNEEDLKEFTKEFNLDLSNLCPLSSEGTDEEQREERYQKWGCKYRSRNV